MFFPVLCREADGVGLRDLTYSFEYNPTVDHHHGLVGNPDPYLQGTISRTTPNPGTFEDNKAQADRKISAARNVMLACSAACPICVGIARSVVIWAWRPAGQQQQRMFPSNWKYQHC